MILLIDNYDSFSYNLYQLIGKINPDIKVIRNDELTIKEIKKLKPTHIILSPEPGKPIDAGICESVIMYFKDRIPILGICLGHQVIAQTFGATVTYAKKIVHGKQSKIKIIKSSKIFKGLDEKFYGARYHSLSISRETLPKDLIEIATSDDEEIMAIKHMKYPVYGLQFHPESILTMQGDIIIKNFLELGGVVNDKTSNI